MARRFSLPSGCGLRVGGRTPPSPQRRGPRMTSEAGERAERRRRRRREAGGGRAARLGRALLRPARGPCAPLRPHRSVRAALWRPQRAPRSAASAARGSSAQPSSSSSSFPSSSFSSAAGHAAAGRGRDAAGEAGTRAASPSPSGSRTAGRLPLPSSSSLPAPSLLLLLLSRPWLPAPCPQGEILGTH